MARTIELYDMLKGKLGETESKALIDTIEEAGKSARVEYKDDLKAIRVEMATKADLKLLEVNLESRMRLYFLILLFVMFLTNPGALELFRKLLVVVK
jgi:hypothetical protein